MSRRAGIRRRAALAGALSASLAGALPGSAAACRLALVIALDVSSSVDAAEDRLQREGLAAALLAPEVRAAIFAAPDPVSLYVFEWSGRFDQRRLLDWTSVATPAALAAAADTVARSQRGRSDMPTATGFALGHAVRLFDRVPECRFRTIDLAGDGITNEGFGPALAYRTFPFAGVTVNGLLVDDQAAADRAAIRAHYEEEILHGPGAFLEVAQGYEDYARAMRRKLVRELGVPVLGREEAPPKGADPAAVAGRIAGAGQTVVLAGRPAPHPGPVPRATRHTAEGLPRATRQSAGGLPRAMRHPAEGLPRATRHPARGLPEPLQ